MLGFAPAILLHLRTLVKQNYAGTKISPSGFLKLLREHSPKVDVLSINGQSVANGLKVSTSRGHIREVKYKFLPRITPDQVGTEDNCDNDIGFQYTEGQLDTPLFSKLSFFLEWGFVERYQEEASRLVTTGNPGVTVLNELLEQLMHCVNGVVNHMDGQLVNSVVWGTNVTTGNNAATALNINRNGTVLDLSDGVIQMMADAQNNEFVGTPLIAGSGIFNNFQLARPFMGANQSGMNQGAVNPYNYYFDVNTASRWGVDQVGLFAPGSVGMVDLDRYIAWKAGRFGTSEFTQIFLPIESAVPGQAPMLMPFNVQIKEFDCPTEAFDGYVTRTVDRGYQVIITKAYGLFQPPSTQFQATDRLTGNNGALRYVFSNDCEAC